VRSHFLRFTEKMEAAERRLNKILTHLQPIEEENLELLNCNHESFRQLEGK